MPYALQGGPGIGLNPSTLEVLQRARLFEASLGSRMRFWLNKQTNKTKTRATRAVKVAQWEKALATKLTT